MNYLHLSTCCIYNHRVHQPPLDSNFLSLCKPESTRLSQFHFSLSSPILLYSHRILSKTFPSTIFPFSNMNLLPSAPKASSYSSKASPSCISKLSTPSSSMSLPSQAAATPSREDNNNINSNHWAFPSFRSLRSAREALRIIRQRQSESLCAYSGSACAYREK